MDGREDNSGHLTLPGTLSHAGARWGGVDWMWRRPQTSPWQALSAISASQGPRQQQRSIVVPIRRD